MAQTPIAVLGTGMAGFGAGHTLNEAGALFVCYDKAPHYGGHTRSIRYPNGFVFDDGVHISFTKDASIKQMLAENVDGQYEERKLTVDNYWHGYRIRHPVQCNLRGLPVDLLIKIIADFIASPAGASDPSKKATQSNPGTEPAQGQHSTYADWLYAVYGRTLAETFPIAYGKKYHTTTMDQLTTEWIGPRMYQPKLEDILRGALDIAAPETHYVQSFRYPSKGGFVSYLDAFAKRFDIRLNHRLVGLDPYTKLLHFADGATQRYSAVISSIPLPELVPMIAGVPHTVIEASRELAFTTAVLFNIGLDRADLSETALTYFYDDDVIFSRISLPHMLSENNAPRGCGAIQAEVHFSEKYKPLRVDPESLIGTVVRDLRRCGVIREKDRILMTDTTICRYANVIYDLDRTAALSTVQDFLDSVNVHCCGRYGKWDHAWTDEAFISGKESAMTVLDRR